MKDRVLSELRRIEREHDCRVLLAVESGSRAWGFASPDSDFDVRFVYAKPRDWYLSIVERRDVIEEMLPGDLDVSGWELRKTLRLFSKCNLALNEWLGSPILYGEVPEFRQQLLQLLPAFFNPYAGLHHYRSMATRALEENLQDGGLIGIKKLFYVLRPLLACRWISQRRSQPPTLFTDLLDSHLVSDEERAWIDELRARKAQAREADSIRLDTARVDDLRREIEDYRTPAAELAPFKPGSSEDLDRVLATWTLP